jgi:small subunit ribosomal protein S2
MKDISLKELLEAGCHFGHQTTRWNPRMKSYIFAARNKIHIFDLAKTKAGLDEAATFAKATASQGGKIVFVGTKRQSQDIVKEYAGQVGMPFITERWVGGFLTNWEMVKKRINHLLDLKAGKAEDRFKNRTKRERVLIDREIAKLEKIFGGVSTLKEKPAAIFITDVRKDASAVKEANSVGVKVIAIVDTNANPDGVDFVIPANDDATKCLQLIVGHITEAISEGIKTPPVNEVKVAEEKKTEKKEDKAEVKEEVKEKKEVKETKDKDETKEKEERPKAKKKVTKKEAK